MDRNKMLFFGWDGVPPNLIELALEYGYIPNLKDLIDRGVFGTLRSVLPIVTPANWYSSLTGFKPMKHGIVNFAVVDTDYSLRYMSILDLKVDGLWDYLGRGGYRGLYVNIPISTPAPSVEGVWIAQEQEFIGPIKPKHYHISPKDMRDKVEDLGFLVGYPFYSGKPREYSRLVREVEDKKLKAFYELLRMERWDLNLYIAMSPDILLHIFMDDDNYMDEIFKTLNLLDQWLGRFIDVLGDDANYVVISDHGHSRKRGLINILKILEDLGYLRRIKRRRIKASWVRRSRTIRKLWGILPQSVKARVSRGINKFLLLDSPSRELIVNVDWGNTSVFPLINVGGLKTNLKGIYRMGTIPMEAQLKLINELGDKLVDYEYNGEKLFTDIEININNDPYLPDILLELHKDYWFISSIEDEVFIEFKLPRLRDDMDLGMYSTTISNHIRDAFYVWSGRDIANHKDGAKLDIVDITPTILYLYDLPIVEHMDGKVRTDIISDEVRNARKPRYVKYKRLSIKEKLVKVRRKIKKEK